MWWWGIACSAPPDVPATPPPGGGEPIPHALVIVIDGVRTDEIAREAPSSITGLPGPENAPRLWADVAPDALVSRAVLNTGATITAPAHAALLTGRPEAYANYSVEAAGPGLYRPLHPTLFEELGGDSIIVSNTTLLEGLTGSVASGAVADWVSVTAPNGPGDDAAVLAEVRRIIAEDPPRLLVVNLHDVDRAGHHAAAEEYPERVATADAGIASLYAWIQDREPAYAASLLFVVTADHGRHRHDGEESWRNHGDSCDGCREVPLFVVGADTGERDDLHAVDLTPTLAAHLGVEMPWATGLPLAEGVVRSGDAAIARSGELVVTQRWRPDAERTEVALDTLTFTRAEAPAALVASFGRVACWRALEDTGGARPWVPRCHADTGAGWQDIGFPAQEVGPFGAPALAERDGRLEVVWVDNPNAAADNAEAAIARATWSAVEGWSEVTGVLATFPTDPTIIVSESAFVTAFGTSLPEPEGRYTRRIRVLHDDGATDLTLPDARLELPALAASGGYVRIAMIAIDATGPHVAVAESADGGRTFGPIEKLGPAVPFLAPAWAGEAVVWVADGEVCRHDSATTCIPVGSPRVASFAPHAGGVTVVRDAGVAEWERVELEW